MTDQHNVDVDPAARHEELRFAKKQQWYVATSAVTLLAAIFAIARSTTLSDVEQAIATVFIVFIATFGIVFLFHRAIVWVIISQFRSAVFCCC